jgi:hypothetical protein
MKPKYYAYKVFKEVDGKLQSAGTLPSWLVYTYRLGKYNFPTIKHSQFFVFKELERAKIFRRFQSPDYLLYKVECFTRPVEVSNLPELWLDFSIEPILIESYWNKNYLPSGYLGKPFEGVHRTYGVKLIERL